jgi:hypothetical protein
MTNTRLIELPFPGFYNSELSEAIDREEEQHLEYLCDDGYSDDSEAKFPEPLRIDGGAMASLLMACTNYRAAYLTLAQHYTAAFDETAGDILGCSVIDTRQSWTPDGYVTEKYDRRTLGLVFESMSSPPFYNFETDRLFCMIPMASVQMMFDQSAKEGHSTLAKVIAERHTSRSGFASSYDNTLSEWLAKSLEDWDHNELETLLIAALTTVGADPRDGSSYDYQSFKSSVFEATVENEGAYSAWSDAVDWTAFDAARDALRSEKLADWRKTDPAAAAEYAASTMNKEPDQ